MTHKEHRQCEALPSADPPVWIPYLYSHCPACSAAHLGRTAISRQLVVSQVFNISYNSIQGLPPIWMFADNVPTWAEGGIDIRVRLAEVYQTRGPVQEPQ
jgi:hypothetical protein